MRDISYAISILRDTPVPAILVGGGIVFLLLAFVGQIAGRIVLSPKRQKWAGVVGVVLMLVGIGMYMVPDLMPTTGGEGTSVTPAIVQEAPPTTQAQGTALDCVPGEPSDFLIQPNDPYCLEVGKCDGAQTTEVFDLSETTTLCLKGDTHGSTDSNRWDDSICVMHPDGPIEGWLMHSRPRDTGVTWTFKAGTRVWARECGTYITRQ